MKLATYKDGSRDGQLVVVSRDLSTAHYATGIASKLQQVLDDWNFLAPQLEDLYTTLNQGKARHAFPFDPERCMAPLPRAYQWADGSAYLNHVELVRAARSSEVPSSFYTDPLMYQGGSDDLQGPTDDIVLAPPGRSLPHAVSVTATSATARRRRAAKAPVAHDFLRESIIASRRAPSDRRGLLRSPCRSSCPC